jgi:hypothetical protein
LHAAVAVAEQAGQVDEPLATLKLASGGLAPNEVTEVAVNPTGFPSVSNIVITATPEAWFLNVFFSASTASLINGWLFSVASTFQG